MKSIRSYIALYRALINEKGAKSNLTKLRKLATKAFAWLVLVEAVIIAQIYPTKFFVDGLTQDKPFSYMAGVSACILVIYLAGSLLYQRMDHYRIWSMYLNYMTILGYSHQHLLMLDVNWHSRHSTGEKESVLSKNMRKIDRLTDEFVFEAIPATLRVICVTFGLLFVGWQFALISLTTVLLYFLAASRTERRYEPSRAQSHAEDKAFNRVGSEQINNWRTIKQFGLERNQSRGYIGMLDSFVESERLRFDSWLRDIRLQDAMVSISRATLYGFLAWQYIHSSVSLGEVFLVTAWLEKIYSNLYQFVHFQRYKNEGEEALHELAEMLQTKPQVAQAQDCLSVTDVTGSVVFSHVNFSYDDSKEHALQDISLQIEPYQAIAMVGPSGSGKSTVASLLLREYDPTSGTIHIGNKQLSEVDFEAYRQNTISVVSQTVQLFDASVADNIRLANPNANDATVYDAARRADIHEFIETLEFGYDTIVGQDGIRLSGGQKQRLAIARALIKNPQLLVLDEATSALDAISQAEVQKSIESLIKRRECTIVIIAHRFSTIEMADKVVVLENGKIAEIGTHEQLEKHNGLYKRLKDLEIKGRL